MSYLLKERERESKRGTWDEASGDGQGSLTGDSKPKTMVKLHVLGLEPESQTR